MTIDMGDACQHSAVGVFFPQYLQHFYFTLEAILSMAGADLFVTSGVRSLAKGFAVPPMLAG